MLIYTNNHINVILQMSNQKKTVYVPLAVDFIHSGHLNIINIAKKYSSPKMYTFLNKVLDNTL